MLLFIPWLQPEEEILHFQTAPSPPHPLLLWEGQPCSLSSFPIGLFLIPRRDRFLVYFASAPFVPARGEHRSPLPFIVILEAPSPPSEPNLEGGLCTLKNAYLRATVSGPR